MRRYEIYLDNNDRLCLAEFKRKGSKYEKEILKGANTYVPIRHISSGEILASKRERVDYTIQYDNCIVNLNEYQKLMDKKGMAPIFNSLKKYNEKLRFSGTKRKKVTRRNKHTGRKIIAGALVLGMLGCGAYNLVKDELPITKEDLFNIPISQQNEEDFVNVNTIIEIEDEPIFISIDYQDNSSTNKAIYAKDNYNELITKYARQYGIDPALALGVATQERGIHSTTMDPGGATGLMQIQNSVWVGQTVSAYNFETKQWETFKITLDNIGDLETNIKIGCMILQNTMQYMKNNIPAAIQCYNMGSGNMNIILNTYAKSQNKTIDEVLSDPTDIGWLEYRNLIKVGDAKYLEHVLQWIGDEVNIKNVKPNGELVEISVSNELETKKVY